MLASSYPLLNAFLTMLEFFGLVLWFWLIIVIFTDITRSHDLSGWGKALWLVAIVIIPFFGVFIYLIARGSKMHERAAQAAQAQDAAFRDYVQQAAGSGSSGSADQLAKLVDLRDRGDITEEEYQQQKAKVLAA